jgi:hypothetical protein
MSVRRGMRLARRVAGALGAVAAAGVLAGVASPSPAAGGAPRAFVCPNPQNGCASTNHNQVLL